MNSQRDPAQVVVIALVIVATVGMAIYVGMNISPGFYGSVARYQSAHSKEFVRRAFVDFYQKHPETILPEKWGHHTITVSFGNDSLDRASEFNADSVNFFFFSKEKNLIVWSSFSGLHNDWRNGKCELVLVGFTEPEGTWRFEKHLDARNKNALMSIFENEVLAKLDSVTFTRLK